MDIQIGKYVKRKDGRWECKLTLPYNEEINKKPRITLSAKTRTLCKERVNDYIESFGKDNSLEDENLTLEEFSKIWKDQLFDKKINTIKSYERCLDRHILPVLGKKKLTEIKKNDGDSIVSAKIKDGLSSSLIRILITVLKDLLETAVDYGYLKKNVFLKLKCPKPTIQNREKILEDLNPSDFYDYLLGERLGEIYIFTMLTGLRINEVLALTWSRVHLKEKYILVDRALNRHAKVQDELFIAPKSNKKREVSLCDKAVDILNGLKTKPRRQDSTDRFVFEGRNNAPYTDRHIQRRFKEIVTDYGKPEMTFHDLRHIYATMLLESGMDYLEVAKQMGHSDVSITLNVYAYVNRARKQESFNRFDTYTKEMF